MRETRKAGKAIPARNRGAKKSKCKAPVKSAETHVRPHVYSIALELGAEIRLNKPLETNYSLLDDLLDPNGLRPDDRVDEHRQLECDRVNHQLPHPQYSMSQNLGSNPWGQRNRIEPYRFLVAKSSGSMIQRARLRMATGLAVTVFCSFLSGCTTTATTTTTPVPRVTSPDSGNLLRVVAAIPIPIRCQSTGWTKSTARSTFILIKRRLVPERFTFAERNRA